MKKTGILFLVFLLLFSMISCDARRTDVTTDATDPTTEATAGTTEPITESSKETEDTQVTEKDCVHNFSEASCTSPKTCTLCGEKEGEKLPHQPSDPTCTEGGVCAVCKKTVKPSLGHDFVDKTCTRCGTKLKEYIDIACVGDSITAGGYWKMMPEFLVDDYRVNGFGVSGSTGYAAGLDGNPPKPLAYVDQPAHEAAKASNPDIVVIMLGTNDSKSMNADRIKADNGAQYILDMVTQINEYKATENSPQIFLALPPVSFRPETGGISNVNIENLIIPLLMQVAEQTGAIVIDTHEATKGQKEAFPDGVHPNDQGKELLAKTIANAILINEVPPTLD